MDFDDHIKRIPHSGSESRDGPGGGQSSDFTFCHAWPVHMDEHSLWREGDNGHVHEVGIIGYY
jgi:hypothetical protein